MTIKVNYAALEQGQQQMQAISRRIDEKLANLRSQLQKMDWSGQDATAYQEQQRAWDQAIADINAILNEIGGAVGVAKENYLQTEAANRSAWA